MTGSKDPSHAPSAVPRSQPPDVPRRRPRAGARAALTVLSVLLLVLVQSCAEVAKLGTTSARPDVVLRFANTRGPEGEPFLTRLAAVSRSRMGIQPDYRFSKRTLTNEADALRAVQAGEVDLAVVPSRAFGFVGIRDFDALVTPMLVDSVQLQVLVAGDQVGQRMLEGLSSAGMVGVGLLPGPIRLPNGITRPLLGPPSYVGARIAANPNLVAEKALQTIGAQPVESAFSGADIRRFDGAELQAAGVAGNRYDQVIRWMTVNVALWPRPLVVVINASAWQGLTEEQRGWLRQAADDAVLDTAQQTLAASELKTMCTRGRVDLVNASTDEIAQLRSAFAPVEQSMRDQPATGLYIDRIRQLKDRLGPGAAAQERLDCHNLDRHIAIRRTLPLEPTETASPPLGTQSPSSTTSAGS